MKPHFFARSPGWLGMRWNPAPSRYFVIRDRVTHWPKFSERNGYRPFRSIIRIGKWEAGWFS